MSLDNIEFGQSATSEELNLYDIHLQQSIYHTLPDLSGLTEEVPAHLQPMWDNLTQALAQKLVPGFMGLNLPANLAAELLERIEIAGGRGLVVPIGYRHPKVTIEMAYPIAQRETNRIQALRNYKTVEPTKYYRQEVMWWQFFAARPELIEKGHIPGGVIVCVDKLDGHIWTGSYFLAGEEYCLESATSLEPMEVLKLAADKLGLEWSTDHKHHNKPCLKAPALVVGAIKLRSARNFVEKKYGFQPTVQMWFRLNRYKRGYEEAGPLMMRVVGLVLKHDPADAVLVCDDEIGSTVIKRISGQLTIDEKWSSWIEPELK